MITITPRLLLLIALVISSPVYAVSSMESSQADASTSSVTAASSPSSSSVPSPAVQVTGASVQAHANAQRKAPQKISSNWRVAGKSSASDRYDFTITLQGADEAGLAAKMLDLAKKGGPWLTVKQLRQYSAPTDQTLQTTKSYLYKQGFTDNDMTWNRLGDAVTVQSTVGRTARIFNATFTSYSFKGGPAVARTKAYTIPLELQASVIDAYPLANFAVVKRGGPAPALIKVRPAPLGAVAPGSAHEVKGSRRKGAVKPSVAWPPPECGDVVTYSCLRSFYNTTSTIPPKGSASTYVMGMIGESFSQDDVATSMYNYRRDASGYQVNVKNTRGAYTDQNNPTMEASLDVQVAVGLTYPAKVTYYNVGTTSMAGDVFQLAFSDLIQQKGRPGVLSISYLSEEDQLTQSQATLMCKTAQQLTALGTTIVLASGDWGKNGIGISCGSNKTWEPTYPSGCPYILSVGATQNFAPEVMTTSFPSGAGYSNFFSTPSYQQNVVSSYNSRVGTLNSAGKWNPSGRAFPDIVAQGFQYATILNGGGYAVSGSSAAAPTVASLLTLVNSLRKQRGMGRVGWVNPTLYNNPGIFNDITTGASQGCDPNDHTGFTTGPGWDAASGLGSPDFTRLRSIFGV